MAVTFSQIPLAQALSGLLHSPANNVAGGAVRTAWSFTSTLRLLGQGTAWAELSLTSGTAASRVTTEALGYAGQVGIIPVINMAINPRSVQFNRPKRMTQKKTPTGTVLTHWTDRRGRNGDLLTLTFEGSTGNIDMRGSDGSGPDTGAAYKLQVWHNLWLLTQEPVLIGDRLLNEAIITYTSPLMRVPIEFRGQFAREMTFTETADKPHSRDYSMEFIVTRMEPEPVDIVNGILSSMSTATISPVITTL